MGGTANDRLLSIIESISSNQNLQDIFNLLTSGLGQLLSANRVIVYLSPELKGLTQRPIEWSILESDSTSEHSSLAVLSNFQPIIEEATTIVCIDNPGKCSSCTPIQHQLMELDAHSILLVPCRYQSKFLAGIILFRGSHSQPWSTVDYNGLEYVSLALALAVDRTNNTSVTVTSGNQDFARLIEHCDALIFNTDQYNVLQSINSRALDFFGIKPQDLINRTKVEWYDLIYLPDRTKLYEKLQTSQIQRAAFEEQCRVVNHITGRLRWLYIRLTPNLSPEGRFLGWDGFGLDFTSQVELQEALEIHTKKLRTLYTVSSSISGYLDPSNIATRGLVALNEAVGAKFGLCYLYSPQRSIGLNLVATFGFPAGLSGRSDSISVLERLVNFTIERGDAVLIRDLAAENSIAYKRLSEREGIKTALLVPVKFESELLGVLALFNQDVSRVDGSEMLLINAVANHIGVAARQANLVAAYKKQTKSLSALYRISHELSRFHTLEELFQRAFRIIRDEIGIKRIWLGLLNETGSHIIGQAAYGPGWKRKLVEMNVDVSVGGHPIAEVLIKKIPTVISDPEKLLSAFGLKRFFSRFGLKSLAIVPLVIDEQVLGVLAVQAATGEEILSDDELSLLSSLGSEIASVILTKRLEERVSDGEKMRTAGLLAAGIAHNFNNLLQAVLGQASLLEMGADVSPNVLRAAKVISESASKGAILVKQLSSFANLEEPQRVRCNINEMLLKEMPTFVRLISENQKIRFMSKRNLPFSLVDPVHLVRIITTLLLNAKDAMKEKGGIIQVFTNLARIGEDSPQVEVPFGEYVIVGVRDSGVGMDAETRRRCFEPFFTTKNVDVRSGIGFSGTGLGLAAAYALARRNNGRLVVDSRLGYGSLFTLYIPVAEMQNSDNESDSNLSTRALPEKESGYDNSEINHYVDSDVIEFSHKQFDKIKTSNSSIPEGGVNTLAPKIIGKSKSVSKRTTVEEH